MFAHVCFSRLCGDTCAVGPPAVNVVVRFPLLSDLVGVSEHDGHRHQADEGHQHRRAQRRVDVGDEAPAGGKKVGGGLVGGKGIRRNRRVRFSAQRWQAKTTQTLTRSTSRVSFRSIFVVPRLSPLQQTGSVRCKYRGGHKFHTTFAQPLAIIPS